MRISTRCIYDGLQYYNITKKDMIKINNILYIIFLCNKLHINRNVHN